MSFTRILDTLKIVNLDITPSLGLNCTFNGFDCE